MSIGFGYAGWLAFGNETTYNTPPTGTNEVQNIAINGGAPTSGVLTLKFDSIVTGNINWNDSAATIQTTLQTAWGSANVTSTGSPAAGPIVITFAGIYGNKALVAMTANSNTFAGGSYSGITITRSTPGVQPTLVYKELMDEGIELKQSMMEKPTLGQTSITHAVKSKASVEGPFKFQMQFNDVERLLYNAFGKVTDATHAGETIVYDHTFALQDALPTGMSVWVDRDSADIGNRQFQYPGCMINKLTLTQDVEQMLIATVELVGSGVETLTYPIAKPTAHTFNQIDYMMFQAASCTVNGVAITAKSFEVVIDNQLSKDRYQLGSNTRLGLQRGNVRKVTGKITLEFQSTAQILLFEQYTQFTIAAVWQGANVAGSSVPTPYKATFTLNNCALSGKTPNVKDWNVIEQELEFQAFATVGSENEISLVLTNDVSTMV